MAADLRNQLLALIAAQGAPRRAAPVQPRPLYAPRSAQPANPAVSTGAIGGMGQPGLTQALSQPAPAYRQNAASLGNQIAWGGQRFANPAALVAWINARGGGTSTGQFLRNHPGVAQQYGQRQVMPVQPLHQLIANAPERRAYSYT